MIGLIFPLYITNLEFKSKEELQLMPQTEEEHLIGLEEENESVEGGKSSDRNIADTDIEVIFYYINLSTLLQVLLVVCDL